MYIHAVLSDTKAVHCRQPGTLHAAKACTAYPFVSAHLYVSLLEDEHAAGEGDKEAQAVLDAQKVGGPHLAPTLICAYTHIDNLVTPGDVAAASRGAAQTAAINRHPAHAGKPLNVIPETVPQQA
jgi:hypothetical protein